MYQQIVTISSLILGAAAAVCAVTIQNDPLIITRSSGDLRPSAGAAVLRPPYVLRDFALRTSGEQIRENDTFVITGSPPAASRDLQ